VLPMERRGFPVVAPPFFPSSSPARAPFLKP
jgi:hypothetical protein